MQSMRSQVMEVKGSPFCFVLFVFSFVGGECLQVVLWVCKKQPILIVLLSACTCSPLSFAACKILFQNWLAAPYLA